jgi:O-glycosyl hydrolase
MKTALYVARIIHHDLCYANARSWSWWRACGGNYKDGLIRVYERRHQAQDSRLLWALGNYSRFVRPGAVRLEVGSKQKEDPYGVMVSAYRNQDGSLVCVAINYSEQEQPFGLRLSPSAPHTWTMYRTSDAEGETLKPVGTADGQATLAPRSITTFVTE